MINTSIQFNNPQFQPRVDMRGINPSALQPHYKKNLINMAVNNSKIGLYKNLPQRSPIPFSYIPEFIAPQPTQICEVEVVYDHVLEIAEKYSFKGVEFNKLNQTLLPTVVLSVDSKFTGTNLDNLTGVNDEHFLICTNFVNTFGSSPPYPIKDDHSVYCEILTCIKKVSNLDVFLPYNELYTMALVVVTPVEVDNSRLIQINPQSPPVMNSEDLLKTLKIIETIFQATLAKRHPILIIPPIGINDNNPTSDMIMIYNYCIYKYGHMFRKIIFGIPRFYPREIFEEYNAKIVRPQEIVKEIDVEIERELMERNLRLLATNTAETA